MSRCWLRLRLWMMQQRMALIEARLRSQPDAWRDPRWHSVRRRLRQLTWKAHLLRSQR